VKRRLDNQNLIVRVGGRYLHTAYHHMCVSHHTTPTGYWIFFFWHFVNRPLVRNSPRYPFPFFLAPRSSDPLQHPDEFDRSPPRLYRSYFRVRQQEMMDSSVVLIIMYYTYYIIYTCSLYTSWRKLRILYDVCFV